MVKSGNMILFIAECKIWKGASQIQSSIDQLLGYLTWRQSKAALILFVRSKNIDNVLVEIPKQVKAHSYYVRENSIQSKGQLQYILHLESGKDNEIDLSVLVFHLPKTWRRVFNRKPTENRHICTIILNLPICGKNCLIAEKYHMSVDRTNKRPPCITAPHEVVSKFTSAHTL